MPQLTGTLERREAQVCPPAQFVTFGMKLVVVITTERDCELITDFAAHSSGLSKPQMMWVGRRALTYEAGLGGDKRQVRLTAAAQRFGTGAFIVLR